MKSPHVKFFYGKKGEKISFQRRLDKIILTSNIRFFVRKNLNGAVCFIFYLKNVPEKMLDHSQKRCNHKIINIQLRSALPNFRPTSLKTNKPVTVHKFYLVNFFTCSLFYFSFKIKFQDLKIIVLAEYYTPEITVDEKCII